MTDGKMLISIGVVAVLALAVLGGVAIANNNSSNNNGVTDSSDSNAVIESSNNNNAASVPVVEQASASASAASEGAVVTEEIESDSACVMEVVASYPELTEEALIETMVKDMMAGASTSSLIGQYTYADGKLIESEEDVQCAIAMLAENSEMTYEEYSASVMEQVFDILDANGYDVMPIESTTSTALAHEHMYDENGVCVICNEGLSDS